MHDKRLTRRLTDYWDRLRKDAVLPQIEHFSSAAIEDIMGKCCMWRVDVGGINKNVPLYASEFVGEDLKQAIGTDITGEVFAPQFSHFPAARILGKISRAIEDKTIITDEGRFINENNRIVKYRSCLLPFGTKDGTVTNVLLGAYWRIY